VPGTSGGDWAPGGGWAPARPALAPSPPAGSSIMARRFTGGEGWGEGELRAWRREAPHPNPLPGPGRRHDPRPLPGRGGQRPCGPENALSGRGLQVPGSSSARHLVLRAPGIADRVISSPRARRKTILSPTLDVKNAGTCYTCLDERQTQGLCRNHHTELLLRGSGRT